MSRHPVSHSEHRNLEHLNLEQCKKQAKELRKAHGAGDVRAAERIVRHLPRAEAQQPADVLAMRFSLTDAQLVIARELGFVSWPRLKHAIDRMRADRGEAEAQIEVFKTALQQLDASEVARLLTEYTTLRERIDEPLFEGIKPPILIAKNSPELLDVLLEFGADINARSRWKRGGDGVLDDADPQAAEHAIRRGATIDVHSAAQLGKRDVLVRLLEEDPTRLHARGHDGQLPLHVASTPEIVDLLLARGADIEARDIDHVATAAQYAVQKPEVCRRLVERGAAIDVFIGAALGDIPLLERALAEAPASLHAHAPTMLGERRADSGYDYPDPPEDSAHVYTWKIGFGFSPAFAAHRFGHPKACEFLLARCSAAEQLAEACARLDEAAVEELRERYRDAPRRLHERKADLAAGRAMYQRNIGNAGDAGQAVRLFLKAGFAPTQRAYWGAPVLNHAAWFGHAEAVRLLLSAGASVLTTDRVVEGSPLGWALNGCFGAHADYGQYLEVVRLLVAAGAPVSEEMLHTDDPLINRELEVGLRSSAR